MHSASKLRASAAKHLLKEKRSVLGQCAGLKDYKDLLY